MKQNWWKVGRVDELKRRELQAIEAGGEPIALSFQNGKFGAIAGTCLHAGGPLGEGTFENDFIVCPWHNWQFHRLTGEARPGIPAAVARYELKEENGELFINLHAVTEAKHAPHAAHPLTRPIKREPGPLRIAGISTTVMNRDYPRYSTSEALLEESLKQRGQKQPQKQFLFQN